jgi:hypothetical protein
VDTAFPHLEAYLWATITGKELYGEWYEPGWYFYDEAYENHGPFATHDEALANLKAYIVTLE